MEQSVTRVILLVSQAVVRNQHGTVGYKIVFSKSFRPKSSNPPHKRINPICEQITFASPCSSWYEKSSPFQQQRFWFLLQYSMNFFIFFLPNLKDYSPKFKLELVKCSFYLLCFVHISLLYKSDVDNVKNEWKTYHKTSRVRAILVAVSFSVYLWYPPLQQLATLSSQDLKQLGNTNWWIGLDIKSSSWVLM